jgi:hypothetical protein
VNAVKTIAMAATLLLIITCSAQEGHGSQRDTRCCLLEVLHSEELSIGPLLYHTIKVAFLVTAPDVTPFETTAMAMPTPRRANACGLARSGNLQ